jgi:hypothetical protein
LVFSLNKWYVRHFLFSRLHPSIHLDFIRYMVSYVSDLIMDWPERIFSTISHPIFNQASRDHPKYIGTLGGGTGKPGQEGTIIFSNSCGEAKIYGFDLPVVNFPFLGSNIPASSAYGVYIQSWSATLEFVSNTVTS